MYSTNVLSSTEIIKRIKDYLENPANKVEGSLGADNAHAVGKELAKYYEYVNWLQDMHYVDTATGFYLDRKAMEAGVYRKQAVKAVGTVRCYGRPGTLIPAGTFFYSETKKFVATISGTILDGNEYVDISIEAAEHGINSNVPAGAIYEFDSVEGLEKVENLEPTINGAETETDEALRERTLLKMRYPGTSGNIYHYMHWAMEVDGVGRVKVFPEWDGPGTVKVSILDYSQRVASQDLMDKVKMHIDPGNRDGSALAPIGALLTVSTATEVLMNINAKVVMVEEGSDVSGISTALGSILQDHFDELAYNAERITVAKVIDILLGIDGVLDVIECTVNGLATSIPLGVEEIPKVGTVVVS